MNTRVLSGIQPSGSLHMGNYFGAIATFVQLQKQGKEVFIFIADLHALTSWKSAEKLKRSIWHVAAGLVALGLDPKKIVLYRQSDVPAIPTLSWQLSCVTPHGLLARGHAFKDKTKKGIAASLGLFSYPVLQAADILIVRPGCVPVGADQKQHIEMTRDIAAQFNSTFGKVFPLPNAEIHSAVSKVPGTDGEKMSKSYGNTIDIFAPESEIKKQIMGIRTGSYALGAKLPAKGCTILALMSLVHNERAVELKKKYRTGSIGYGEAKKMLLEETLAYFKEARRAYALFCKQPEKIEKMLQLGAKKANKEAIATMTLVHKALGLPEKKSRA